MLRLPGTIAIRYLLGKKSRNAVNIISGIALLGYAVGAFALLTILSALNGFETLLFDVYNDFHPDLRVNSRSGKVFHLDSAQLARLRGIPGVAMVAPVLEDNAVLQAGNQQVICTLKGVDSGYLRSRHLHQRLIAGTTDLGAPLEVPRVVLGEGLDYRLNLNQADQMQGINAIVPDRQSTSIVNPEIVNLRLVPSGVFRLDDEIGNRYAYVSLDFASELFSRDQEYSQLEIMFRSGAQAENVANTVQATLGKDFEIRDRRRQNEALFKMFRTEKWATFAILCFVLGIISFNLTGALSMLVIEKKEDIHILHVMGARNRSIGVIFLFEGLLIALSGAGLGILLSVLAVILQQQYGFITMQSAIIPYYPVELHSADIALVFGVTFVLGFLSSLHPAWRSYKTLN